MRPSPALARWIVCCCGALLLLAQVLGLHYHRHVERLGGHDHGSELHFEDGGLHPGEDRADHRHGGASHWHVDVESKAVKPGLAKAFVDSLLLPLLMLAGLLWPAAGGLAPLRARRMQGCRRCRPFELRPPPQGPPPLTACA